MSPRLFAALLCALACSAATAQEVRAVTEETPYTFLRDGKVAGPATELVERSLQRAGLADHSVQLYPWARAYDLALHEPNVLIFLIARFFVRLIGLWFQAMQNGRVEAPSWLHPETAEPTRRLPFDFDRHTDAGQLAPEVCGGIECQQLRVENADAI